MGQEHGTRKSLHGCDVPAGLASEDNNGKYYATTLSPFPGSSSTHENKFLPSATISYKFDDGGNVYFRYARGFKSGGVNPSVSPTAFPDPRADGGLFGGEEVNTYEVGYRAPLLDRSVQLTTSAFYNDYSNLQVSAHTRPAYAYIIEAIINAGSARTWGLEETLQWRVSDPLTLGVNAGYLNAQYINFQIPSSNPVLEPFNLNGQTMLNSPKFQLSLTANLDEPITDNLRLVGNLVESHISKQIFAQSGGPPFQGAPALPAAIGPGYWITNLRIGVKTADDKYGISVFANNLFNASYFTYGSSAAATGTLLNWGDPRVVGAEATVDF